MIAALFSLVAVALYLAPLAIAMPIIASYSARRDAARVVDAGLILAVDALLTLTLARIVPYWIAVWLARFAWLALGCVYAARRRITPRDLLASIRSVDLREAGTIAVVAFFAVTLVATLSYQYNVWDRDWHIPLVSTLRAQRVPFRNVYLPVATLRYHYLGDTIAASIQVLSCGRIQAALALSLAHDVFAALLPITVLYVMRAIGARANAGALAILAICSLLAGPLSIFRDEHPFTTTVSLHLCGNSYLCLLTLGYRPHTMIAVYFLGVVASTIALRAFEAAPGRDAEGLISPSHGAAVLVASVGGLTLLDETSLGFAGIGLGAIWLVAPRVLAPTRPKGIGLLAALVVTIVVVTLFFQGSLSPGGPVQHIEVLRRARLPGLYQPSYTLDTPRAWGVFALDVFPMVSVALFALYVAARERTRAAVSLAAFFVTVTVLAIYGLLKIEVNHNPEENQRFVTVGVVLAPVVGAFVVVLANRTPIARAILVTAVILPSISSLLWYKSFVIETAREARYTTGFGPYDNDCREQTGPTNGGPPKLRYVERPAIWTYTNCQPTLLGGERPSNWNLAIHPGFDSGVMEMARTTRGAVPVESLICMRGNVGHDGPCTWGLRNLQCRPLTPRSNLVECPLTPAARDELMRRF